MVGVLPGQRWSKREDTVKPRCEKWAALDRCKRQSPGSSGECETGSSNDVKVWVSAARAAPAPCNREDGDRGRCGGGNTLVEASL